jgi:hypothetical protein
MFGNNHAATARPSDDDCSGGELLGGGRLFHSRIVESPRGLRHVALPLAGVLAFLAVLAAFTAPRLLPRYYFLHEDSFVLAALVVLLVAFGARGEAKFATGLPELSLTRRKVLIGATIVALLLWAGTYLVFGNDPLSRDEQMVVFDMQIFRHGLLAAPLAPEWRRYVQVAPEFLLSLPEGTAWVSFYMPVNAMLRTLFGVMFDPAAMNPVLAAAGAVATFDCARRLFPEEREAQAIAVLIYATSAQMLVTAMTPYAMTAHLAFNMIWLSLYLRDTRASHAGAIAVGFLAIGIHQIVFHPLFAIPFIDHLRRRGQWRTAAAYLGCYALFGLFWISYPHIVAISAGLKSQHGPAAGTIGFIAARILPLVTQREPLTIPLMEANLLRFIAWQNLALVPLVILGCHSIRRGDGIARPLAAGLALTVVAIGLLAPYQAIGWGYRYLHGLIGSCALLAGYGWASSARRSELRRFVAAATLATVLGAIPFLTWQAAAFAAPYARVSRMIDGINADMVVIDSEGPVFRIDEVRNRPDLSNRPIRLASHMLKPADIVQLCSRGTIAFVDAKQMQALGLGFGEPSNAADFQALRRAAPALCRR